MLQKQPLDISFAQGLDLKTDPFRVSAGKFLALQNSVFTKQGLLTKRNGFAPVISFTGASTLTTFNDNLIAIGNTLQAFSADNDTLINTGPIQPLSVTTTTLVRTATSQTTVDVAIAPNNLCCETWLDSDTNSYYQVSDSTTGQTIIPKVELPSTAVSSRVFVLGNYFIVTFVATVSSTPTLQYIAIPLNTPNTPSSAITITTTLASLSSSYDGYSVNGQLYLAWSQTSAVQAAFLTSSLALSTPITVVNTLANFLSVTADTTGTSTVIWISWYFHNTITGFKAITVSAYDANLDLPSLLAPTDLVSSININELTSSAKNNVITVFYETQNTYAYNSVKSDFVSKVTCTLSGSIGTPLVLMRGVGLASKSVYLPATQLIYVLVTYGGAFQPTYFLMDENGNELAKTAYSNGGGYIVGQILPQINISGSTMSIGYLFRDLLESVNKTQGATIASGFYAQTGINLVSYTLNSGIVTTEIGNNLHMSGGFVWMYDGVKAVEHQFNLWPEDIGATWNATSTVTPTGTFSSGSTTITVSSGTGIAPGMTVSDTTNPSYISSGTTVVSISGTTMVISLPATHAGSGDTLSIQGNIAAQPDGATNTNAYFYQVTYEWTDSQGNIHRSAPSVPLGITTTGMGTAGTITLDIPTYRTTYKAAQPTATASTTTPANKVRIVIYRWSVAQEIYYQVTSIQSPLLNDPTVDYVTFVDTLPDSKIVGNAIIYTNGGVIEDIAAPSSSIFALFDDRMWLVDAENQNLLWFSKQVIESTPVEFSDLLTVYVAPSTGAQGSTGNLTALCPMDDKLILFKKDAIYYINGTGPDNTGANNQYSQPIFVTSAVGCANPNSIVIMPNGVMFQSDKGIWLLGRDLSTNYIGAPVESFNSATVTSAVIVPNTNQVRFTLNNNYALMYDYYFQQWSSFYLINALSSTLYNSLHTYLTPQGLVLQETPGEYLDNGSPVLLSFTTSWINLAGVQGFERFYFANLLGTYYTPFTLNVQFAYNYNPSPIQAIQVKPTNFTPTWGSEALWGSGAGWGSDDDPTGGSTANIFSARLWPTIQKCQSFQLIVNEVYDSSFGVQAGQGLSLSGLALILGMKKGYRTQSARKSYG